VIYSFNVYDGLRHLRLDDDATATLRTTSSGGDMSVCYYVGAIVFELTKIPKETGMKNFAR